MRFRSLLAGAAVAAAASASFGAINLSAPQLDVGTMVDGQGAKIKFTSDQAGYAVVYIMAHNVPGYNAGEIVQTIRGNMVAGLNEFRWNGSNALIRNPQLINGTGIASNSGVTPVGMIPDGSEVIIRVTAMNQALWNADYIIGNIGGLPIGRYQALDVNNGRIFAGDIGNQTNMASNKVVHIFNASDGSNITTFQYGTIVNNTTTNEPYDIFGEADGSYFVASRYNPPGFGSAGCVYRFDSSGALISNFITGAGFIRSGDRIGTGASSIFYLPVNGSNLLRRCDSSPSITNVAWHSGNGGPAFGLLAPSGVAAVDNGAPNAPVVYVGCENANSGVMRLDWNGAGYVRNEIFLKNFWTDQNVFTWTMLNVAGNASNLIVLGTIGNVTSTASTGPWGNAFYGLALANKGDVNSDIFVRTTGAVWRLKPDGTSAWPGRVLPLNSQGAGIDLAWDGQYLYFTTGSALGSNYPGRWIIRDAFPDQGTVVNTTPQTWNANLLPVGVSRLSVE